MKYIKAFIAGIVIPATILQLAGILEFFTGWPPIRKHLFFQQLPIIWAIWNVAYFAYFKNIWPGNATASYLMHGAILGVLLLIPAFILAIPRTLGFTGGTEFFPIAFVPIIYALIWAFLLRPLNRIFGIE